MLLFDPKDPYPLLSFESHSYSEAQTHSAAADAWLGLQTEPVEKWLRESQSSEPTTQQLWIGLPTQSLLTPYTEFRKILSILAPHPEQTLVDLGAGYGRLGFVIERHYPNVNFIGYEYVAARVDEFHRCWASLPHRNDSRIQMHQADLSDHHFFPAPAEYYFLYDFGTPAAIEKILQDLRRLAQSQKLTVIGRGRACRDRIEREHPWLSQVTPPKHFPHFSIYQS
jgi:hypothetical protein